MGYSAPEGKQFLTIPDAKLCICQRKALHLPTQSFAIAHAKLCNRPRKALQPYLQTFAGKGTKKTFIMKIPS